MARRLECPLIAANVNASVFNTVAWRVSNVCRRSYSSNEMPALRHAASWELLSFVMWLPG